MNIHDDISAQDKKSSKSINSRGSKYEVDKVNRASVNNNHNLPSGISVFLHISSTFTK